MSRTPPEERDGRSALVVVVPQAEPAVGALRARFDSSAPRGMPAHVTILFPFVRQEAWSDAMDARLDALFASHAAFDVVFRGCRRFGQEVLWLAPEPSAPFLALTRAVESAFPGHAPYGGAFAEPVPHLTVAESFVPGVRPFDEIEAMLPRPLDVRSRVDRVVRFVHTDGRWRPVREHSLGEHPLGAR